MMKINQATGWDNGKVYDEDKLTGWDNGKVYDEDKLGNWMGEWKSL